MSAPRGWVIYGLSRGEGLPIRYVGYTTNPKMRLAQHMSRARRLRSRFPLYDWVRSIITSGGAPLLTVLETGEGGGWQEAECRWIETLNVNRLFNMKPGGLAAPVMTADSRRRIAEKMRTRVFTPEHRQRISDAKRGKKRPDNAARNAQLGATLRGKKMQLTLEERSRRRHACKELASGNAQRWAALDAISRQRRSDLAREQMKRVWAERRARSINA